MDEVSSSKCSAAGISKGPISEAVADGTIASASSARSDFAWALGISSNLLPCTSGFHVFSFTVSCSTVLCVLFSSFCLFESNLLQPSCVFGDTAEK